MYRTNENHDKKLKTGNNLLCVLQTPNDYNLFGLLALLKHARGVCMFSLHWHIVTLI